MAMNDEDWIGMKTATEDNKYKPAKRAACYLLIIMAVLMLIIISGCSKSDTKQDNDKQTANNSQQEAAAFKEIDELKSILAQYSDNPNVEAFITIEEDIYTVANNPDDEQLAFDKYKEICKYCYELNQETPKNNLALYVYDYEKYADIENVRDADSQESFASKVISLKDNSGLFYILASCFVGSALLQEEAPPAIPDVTTTSIVSAFSQEGFSQTDDKTNDDGSITIKIYSPGDTKKAWCTIRSSDGKQVTSVSAELLDWDNDKYRYEYMSTNTSEGKQAEGNYPQYQIALDNSNLQNEPLLKTLFTEQQINQIKNQIEKQIADRNDSGKYYYLGDAALELRADGSIWVINKDSVDCAYEKTMTALSKWGNYGTATTENEMSGSVGILAATWEDANIQQL